MQKGDYKVCIRKGAKPPPPPPPAKTPSAQKANPEAAAGRQTSPEGYAGPAEHFIIANMVGIFHIVDGIANVGVTVSKGEVVGVIESMKLMNEVKSTVAGVVRKVLVEDGTPVQYGDHLFQVEPND